MEPGGVAGGRGRGGLRGARSEEFLDRGHLEQDLRRPSTRSDLTYHIILWSPVEPFNYLCFTINPSNPCYRTPQMWLLEAVCVVRMSGLTWDTEC